MAPPICPESSEIRNLPLSSATSTAGSVTLLLRYGAIAYPVEVVLNEDIAEAYNGKKQYIYDVDSMEELKTMFETIINTCLLYTSPSPRDA